MRSQRDILISHLHRGLHRGQRSMTAQKGRTYDRTAPVAPSFEKALASGAVPHMTLRGDKSLSNDSQSLYRRLRRSLLVTGAASPIVLLQIADNRRDAHACWDTHLLTSPALWQYWTLRGDSSRQRHHPNVQSQRPALARGQKRCATELSPARSGCRR